MLEEVVEDLDAGNYRSCKGIKKGLLEKGILELEKGRMEETKKDGC